VFTSSARVVRVEATGIFALSSHRTRFLGWLVCRQECQDASHSRSKPSLPPPSCNHHHHHHILPRRAIRHLCVSDYRFTIPRFPPCSPCSHIMAADDPMEGVPGAALGEQLATVTDVKEWADEGSFNFIQSQNILPSGQDRTAFRNTEVNGTLFLERGNIKDYRSHACRQPLRPSDELAGSAQRGHV